MSASIIKKMKIKKEMLPIWYGGLNVIPDLSVSSFCYIFTLNLTTGCFIICYSRSVSCGLALDISTLLFV